MPSPFPGMDPYLEDQLWPGFHTQMIAALQVALVPLLRPRYIPVIEERVYVEHLSEEPPRTFRPDVSVVGPSSPSESPGSGGLVVLAPVQLPLPMPERVRERFLEIRRHDTREVVTVLELLSPSNKRAGSAGRKEYLSKREAVVDSRAHLVELDLLRGGDRLPMALPLPAGDYFVIVSRAPQRPIADVWPFTLRHRLPVIPMPLADEDPDVTIDLQQILDGVYDAAGYGYALDYSAPLRQALSSEEAAWVAGVLETAGS